VARSGQAAAPPLAASGPQAGRPVTLAAAHGAPRQPALEEQAGDRAPDRPDLPGGPGDEDQSIFGHATSLPCAASVMPRSYCPAPPRLAGLSGGCAPCVWPLLAGPHDDAHLICPTPRPAHPPTTVLCPRSP